MGDLLNAAILAALLFVGMLAAPVSAFNPMEDSALINPPEQSLMPVGLIPEDATESIVFIMPENFSPSWLTLAALEKESVRQAGLADQLHLGVPDHEILPTELPGRPVVEFSNSFLLRDKVRECVTIPTQAQRSSFQLSKRP